MPYLTHMPTRSSKPKRPRDVSQRAKLIVDIATGEVEDKCKELKQRGTPRRDKLRMSGGTKDKKLY